MRKKKSMRIISAVLCAALLGITSVSGSASAAGTISETETAADGNSAGQENMEEAASSEHTEEQTGQEAEEAGSAENAEEQTGIVDQKDNGNHTEEDEKTKVDGNKAQDADGNAADDGSGTVTEHSSDDAQEEAGSLAKENTAAEGTSAEETQASGGETAAEETLVNGVPVDEEGLPKKGLLLTLEREDDTEDQEDDDEEDPPDPELFVKLNPCGKREHNTQPDNYMSSALGCVEYIFERDEGESSYHIVMPVITSKEEEDRDYDITTVPVKADDYLRRAVESYSDTNDLWHSFLLSPPNDGTDRVYALVPLGITDGAFTGASDQYCFRYEIAMADEQNWEMEEGSKISGGYVVYGAGETEHDGTAVEHRTIHLKKKTGGREFSLEYLCGNDRYVEDLPDTGLLLSLDSLPESAMSDELTLRLTCPEKYQNGEGGFGFSSEAEYRKEEYQKWKYQITEKGGMRAVVQGFRPAEEGYQKLFSQLLEVSGEGGVIDLNTLGLQEGDIISVLPYTIDWKKYDQSGAESKEISTMRFFHFQYEISCAESTISAQGQDGTEIRVQDARHVRGMKPVADDGEYFQKVSLTVTGPETENGSCGWQTAWNLPNYGFMIRRTEEQDWSVSWPVVAVIPQKKDGETHVLYAAEWYQKKENAYSLIRRKVADITTSVMLACGDRDWGKKADLMVIRRIRFPKPAGMEDKNVFETDISPCEASDGNGNTLYPQSGKDTLEVYPMGNARLKKDGTVRFGTYSIWKNADPSSWETEPGETGDIPETVLRGIPFQLDLSEADERVKMIEIGQEKQSVALKQQTDPENGLPAHSLVVMNRTTGELTDDGVEYNVQLEMPVGIMGYSAEAASDGGTASNYGVLEKGQRTSCHVYRQNEDGTWEKADQNSDADWVNSGTQNFPYVGLADTYSYSVHAHLKDKEAIVITPETDFYDISYSVSMNSYSEYAVLPDQCEVPDRCTHLTRHYFQGTFSNEEKASEAKNAVLVVATMLKNADTGETDQASPLPETQVKALKVNLFDYDFGKEHDFVLGDQKQIFRFNYDPKNVRDVDINMWHSGACTGILEHQLDQSGLPVFRFSTPFEEQGAGLFDSTNVSERVNGGTKKSYMDVDFDFIYNSKEESYSYNSALNAACFDGKGHVREYDRTLGIDDWGSKGAGFFPFNHFDQEGNWGTEAAKNKGTYLISKENGINYHFGMSTTQTFEIPEDGTVNGKNLKFHFSGDDDAWVFIDGQLVLDMGGIHEAVQGDIDFTNGTWCVTADQNSPWNTFGNSYTAPVVTRGALSEQISDFPTDAGSIGGTEGTWARGTKHTFSFFYLERGGTLSDLSMDFNLPTVEESPDPEQPKEAFLRTGQGGIYVMQLLGGGIVLAGAFGIRRRRHR